jgi:hypothetical protein
LIADAVRTLRLVDPTRVRCAVASEARDEPLAGTASTVRSWLLLEHPGPWGRDAFVDGRHASAGFGAELSRRARAAGVRPLLIRRVGGAVSGRRRCFAASSAPGAEFVERTDLAALDDALALELTELAAGRGLGLERHDEALFLVCTHGRHDACCAERGRPLAAALAAAFPEQTWEASHIGGDRFAGNVLALPHGLYFGRVDAEEAEAVARAYLEGRLSLPHLRGRSTESMPVQFAEHALRLELGLDRIDDVVFRAVARPSPDAVVATFATPDGEREVTVSIGASPPALLTDHSVRAEAAPAYAVTAIGAPTPRPRARPGGAAPAP